MCGIVGVFGELPNIDIFTKANESLNHRGPDDSGIFFDEKLPIRMCVLLKFKHGLYTSVAPFDIKFRIKIKNLRIQIY